MLEMIMGILIWVFMLLGLIISIIVLIKQFKHGGALHGIIGLITCFFWTFIWGWIKHKSLAMTKLMVLWTVSQLAPVVLIVVFGAAMMTQMIAMFGEMAGDPSLLLKQDQKIKMTPRLKKKGAPAKLPQRTVQRSSGQTNMDWAARAMALWKDGKYTSPKNAKGYWDKAIAANPKSAEAYNNRGLAYYNLNQYQQAINDFSQAIRMNPKYPEAFNNRGNTYYELDQYQKAEADFNKSLELKPKYSKAHMNRGLAYFQMEKMKQSCQDFRKACDLGECDGLQWAMQHAFCN